MQIQCMVLVKTLVNFIFTSSPHNGPKSKNNYVFDKGCDAKLSSCVNTMALAT